MKVQGKFKEQAHINSGVVMDVAAFEVSHSVGIDIDATTLRAARARSSSIHRAMDNTSRKVQNVSAHSRLRTHKAADSEFSGAMEDMPGKVQNASTHKLRRKNQEHAHSSWSVQGIVQWGDG